VTAAVLGLVIAYLLLAVLLLSLNLRSAWRWRIKAVAILATSVFFVLTFVTIQAMLGWPTESEPPSSFQLHAALVQEPERRVGRQGRIYLWLSPKHAEGAPAGPPRAYALPYSRALHQAVARAQARLEEGVPIEGETRRAGHDEQRFGHNSLQIDLFDAPVAALPPKTAG
jgi:hypothetical protein